MRNNGAERLDRVDDPNVAPAQRCAGGGEPGLAWEALFPGICRRARRLRRSVGRRIHGAGRQWAAAGLGCGPIRRRSGCREIASRGRSAGGAGPIARGGLCALNGGIGPWSLRESREDRATDHKAGGNGSET